jgi:hypothetical protein
VKPANHLPTDTVTSSAVGPLQQAVADARESYRASVADARAKWEAEAIVSFDKSEALRRAKAIEKYKYDNPFQRPLYKYQDWDDESVFRDMQDPTTRLERLLDAKLYRQYLKCMLVRAGGTASIARVKAWLAPHIPVDGDHVIRPNETELTNLVRRGRPATFVYADGLSKDLHSILTRSYMLRVGLHGVEFDWRAEHNDRSSW